MERGLPRCLGIIVVMCALFFALPVLAWANAGDSARYAPGVVDEEVAVLETQEVTLDTVVYHAVNSKSGIYHLSNTCSGIRNFESMTYGEALERGYRPCKKCATGGNEAAEAGIEGASGGSVPASDANLSAMTRLSGDVALDTMVKIVNEGWDWQTSDTVVLTTVDGYWDALTAAGIAGMVKAPVVMTDGKALSAQASSLLTQMAPQRIIVCGGTSAVSEGVAQTAASAACTSPIVMRCAGDNAVGTAIDVFQKVGAQGLGVWSNTAFLCTSEGYWDALAAAPISYACAMPIFLTSGQASISDETIAAMKEGGVSQVYIVGGAFAISQSVADAVDAAGITVAGRLAGDTAVETSEEVAAFGVDAMNMTADGVGLATTNGYWDALAGAALCGKNGSVLVLADSPNAHSIVGFVKSRAAEIASLYVFGGTVAVSDDTANAARQAAA